MRIDIVTIFPEFFDVLDISLLGKARQAGIIELGVHNLRDATTDRHRTVDDTPYGGGAGMVMKPEPWGAALDAIVPPAAAATTQSAGEAVDRGFLDAKRVTAQHYALHVLPMAGALRDEVLHGAVSTLGLSDDQF